MKKWILIGGATVVVGIVGYLIYSKKKKAALMAEMGDSGNATVPGNTESATSLPAGTANLLRVVKDASKGKAILRVTPKGLFKTGDFVKVNGAVYNGAYKVWYVYTAHATEDAVYIDTPFISDDAGSVSKL